MKLLNINEKSIKDKIFTIRGLQVMLDRDLAKLYGVETRILKQSVKRNIERFPEDFMIKVQKTEIESMVSQNVIPSKQHFGGATPFAFTEHGVTMLASILKSKTAIEVNIRIIRAFVAMKTLVASNKKFFDRLNYIEKRQITFEMKTEEKIDTVLNALEDKTLTPKQGIFYNGQMFDAYSFVSDLVRSAKKSILLIDNYIDDTVLTLFSETKKIDIVIYTKTISKKLKLDLEKYNSQYSPIVIKPFADAHDRFIIIDETEIYHIGASLKDLGKKWFAFSKFDKGVVEMLGKIT